MFIREGVILTTYFPKVNKQKKKKGHQLNYQLNIILLTFFQSDGGYHTPSNPNSVPHSPEIDTSFKFIKYKYIPI